MMQTYTVIVHDAADQDYVYVTEARSARGAQHQVMRIAEAHANVSVQMLFCLVGEVSFTPTRWADDGKATGEAPQVIDLRPVGF